MEKRVATFSAVVPMGVYTEAARRIASGESEGLFPLIGTIVIDSTPPAITTSAEPVAMAPAARAMACRPLEQKRLMVIALVASGSPPRKPATRATLSPCSPSGMAQPMTRSSTSSGFTCGTRARRPAITWPASSSGRVSASVPLCARPTAERTASTITTSMGRLLVPQGLVVHQHVLHALEALRLAGEPDEGLALVGEHLGLGHLARGAAHAAAQHSRELARDEGVVRGRLAARDERVDAHLQGRDAALAREPVRARRGRVVARLGETDGARLRLDELPRPVERHAVGLAEVAECLRLVGAGRNPRERDVLEDPRHVLEDVHVGAVRHALERAPEHVHVPAAARDEA